MKKVGLLSLLMLVAHPLAVFADQMDERMARAAAIQEAEENNKLCQLGSPSCKGQFSGVPGGPQAGRAATIPALPALPAVGTQYVPAIGNASSAPAADPEIVDPLERPKTVGLSIVGGQRVAEVRFRNRFVTLREGETLGVWTLANLSESGASWTKTKSMKANPVGNPVVKAGQRVAGKPKLVHDVLGSPSVTAPLTIR